MRKGIGIFILAGILASLITTHTVTAQRVGVVLSGGGAKGLAHIGVLQALEDQQVPIDYICGTSIGALVGGLYASGYSPTQIRNLVTSEAFLDMANGKVEDKYTYYFSRQDDDAGWVSIKFYKDSVWKSAAPTNLVSPVALDFEIMARMAEANAAASYNFDSLMIPFRCNAADIASKNSVTFRQGDLGSAIRASMSYPFYLKPIRINGKLLFDGGMYNNFPADVMSEDFKPDVIIGCNVSSNEEPPHEDDILSQVRNMVVSKTDFSLHDIPGLIIEPVVNEAVFNFSKPFVAIDSGYRAAMRRIPEIQQLVPRKMDSTAFANRRNRFDKQKTKLSFHDIYIDGLNRRQQQYVKRMLIRKRLKTVRIGQLKKGYFRVFGDDKIGSIYPTAKLNDSTGMFDLFLNVKREKDLIADFGGNFASTPINTAFIGLKYNHLGNSAVTLMANSYFGKLYGSAQGRVRFDFPLRIPFYLEGGFTLNRFNYFRSQSFFFEEDRPGYVLQSERYGDLQIGLPVRNKDRVRIGGSFFNLNDEYYQAQNFTQSDTADQTTFDGSSFFIQYERSNLNHKLYANSGSYLGFEARYIAGEELNEPGSTSDLNRNFRKLHDWTQFKLTYDNYYRGKGAIRLGLFAEASWSNQLLFNNYTASILRASAFQPIPHSKTLFLESYRALQYAALGHKVIFNVWGNFDLRLEAYVFQPYKSVVRTAENDHDAIESFEKRFVIGSATAVFHSPIGPVSAGLNYYQNDEEVAPEDNSPFHFLFHIGYIIFNQRAIQ